jgi:galactokinase
VTAELARKVAMLFEFAYGQNPDGVWSAPGRVNLIGEHTDYNEGFVLPFAINRRTFAAVSKRSDSLIRVSSTFAPEPVELDAKDISAETARGWAAYPLGVVWALREKAGTAGTGLDIFIDSDVPVGAGLSSSAAIECAVAVAVNDLWSLGFDERTLARVGQRAENAIVGAPTGIMDQSASMLGRLDHAVFIDCRSLEAESVELGFAEAGLEILIIDTKVAHRHADGGYASRRLACELGARVMGVAALRDLSTDDLVLAAVLLEDENFRRVRHVVTENQRVLDTVQRLRADGPGSIGDLLYASHESMRDDFEISVDELDTAVETALRHGAIGARMTGGGFGGAAIALTPIDKISEVTLAIKAEFASLGFATPDIFAVSAAPGAGREI